MNKAYEWILFDQGGTLFEPLPDHYSERNQRLALVELGATALASEPRIRTVFKAARRVVNQRFLGRAGYLHRELVAAHLLHGLVSLELCDPAVLRGSALPAALADVVARYCDRQAQSVVENLRLYSDCHSVLAALAQHFSLAIVSNNAESYLQPLIARCRLGAYLQGAYTSDSLGACKPHPDIFAAAFAELGISALDRGRVLYVGDTVDYDVAGGCAANLDVALLANEPTPPSGAVVVVRTLTELGRWLLPAAD